jgi:hypothetical protein
VALTTLLTASTATQRLGLGHDTLVRVTGDVVVDVGARVIWPG